MRPWGTEPYRYVRQFLYILSRQRANRRLKHGERGGPIGFEEVWPDLEFTWDCHFATDSPEAGRVAPCRLVGTNPAMFLKARLFWINFRVADYPRVGLFRQYSGAQGT